jgi:O-antigen ligase
MPCCLVRERNLVDLRVRSNDEPTVEGESRVALADLIGLLLLLGSAIWTYVSAAQAGGDPDSSVALHLVMVGAYVVGRLCSTVRRSLAPLVVVVFGAVVALYSPTELFGTGPLGGPFGYSNATAAFFVQIAIGGMLLALVAPNTLTRTAAVIAVLLFAAIPLASTSLAAKATLCLGPVTLLFCAWRRTRAAIALAAAVFITAIAASGVAGLFADSWDGASRTNETATSRRLILWDDAIEISGEAPFFGAGPGNFATASPLAREDPDARWAHHEVLERAAETGLPGAALLVALISWAFARLATGGTQDASRAVAAAALGAVTAHACVDYILHFPAIPAVTAFLIGATTGSSVQVKRL